MFGKKEKEEVNKVPVYNVHTLPRNYEPIQTVMAIIKWTNSDQYFKGIEKLGEIGYNVGADAVIGLTFHTPTGTSIQNLYAYGTAIKYLDKEELQS